MPFLTLHFSTITLHSSSITQQLMWFKSFVYWGDNSFLAAIRDLCFVGVVSCADHGAGGWDVTSGHHTAACLSRGQTLLLQLRLSCAGGATFRMSCSHCRTTCKTKQNKKLLELQEDFTGILNSHIIELGIHANIKEYDVEIMKIYARLHRYVLNIKDDLSNNHFNSWQTSLLLSSWDSSGHLETYRSHCAASDGGRWRHYAVVCCGWWRPSWMRRWRSVYWYHWLSDWVEPVLKTEYYSIWTHCHPVQVNR